MRTFLAIPVLMLALSGGVRADQTQAPNTAAKAAEAALTFFPPPNAVNASQSTSETAFQTSWDVTEPAAVVRRQYRSGLDGLQAGSAAAYLALLAPDYQQANAVKAGTARRLTELLTRNQCDSAKFSLVEARMNSADRLTVRVWQEFTFTSRNTPPTYVTTAPGQTHAVNNAGRLTVTQIVQEEWVRSGGTWQIRHAETVAQKAAAVL